MSTVLRQGEVDGVLGCLAAVADFRAQFRDGVAQGEYFLTFRPESAQGDGLFVNFTLSDRHQHRHFCDAVLSDFV